MKRQPTSLSRKEIPSQFRSFLDGAAVFDSSCSPAAKVYFLDKGQGYYLKKSSKGTLAREAELWKFFHTKGLATEVLGYESSENDWLLTARASGEDCIAPMYLEDPTRLCDTLAYLLRALHDTNPAGCPVPDHTREYFATARRNYAAGHFDLDPLFRQWQFSSPEEAMQIAEKNNKYLKTEVLLHGDYCLPNIMLDNWSFSSFIDLGNGGVGDRHVDLFWGIWSLQFNLKTDAYQQRFLDVYGRDAIEPEVFRTIAAIEVFG